MRKKVMFISSVLTLATLLIVSCAPAAPLTTPTPPATPSAPSAPTTPTALVVPTEEKPQQEAVTPSVEMPQYGGTLVAAITTSPNPKGFWPSVYEQLMGNDWRKGPAGTGEVSFAAGARTLDDETMPLLAESWEMPDPTLWILNIRRGVRWASVNSVAGRVTNGREMTADDVINSFNWQLKESPQSWIFFAEPAVGKAASIKKTGPWQVTINTPVDPLTAFGWIIQGHGYHRVYNYDVAKQMKHQLIYQGEGWDYREAVGTGPFIVEEVVAGSLIRYRKNPNYWATDLVGPGKGNKLPYIDTYIELSIPDRSTQLAALRTGKIAFLVGFTRDEWQWEVKLSPNLKWLSYLAPWNFSRFINMRTDKKDKPFSNVKVRQALMMATDFETIKNDYYRGAAEIGVFPVNSYYAGAGYVPLDKMPESTQELYRYNPGKAKQLLKEAGYPNGFKTTIFVPSAGSDVDEVAIFKDMWAKVGVELVLDVKEQTVFNGIWARRAHEEMIYRSLATNWPWAWGMIGMRGTNTFNQSYINDPPGSDPILEKYYNLLNESMVKNMPEVYRLMEEVRPYFNEQAYVIPRPTPYMYTVWQPWLKNFYGFFGSQSTLQYHWIDQELKKKMGH